MNKIILTGNLTRDPETRATGNGATVCSFSIAVNRRFAQQNGEKVTDFFRINAWRQLGDTCAKYLAKGRKVAVIGELQPRTYEGRDGTPRFSLEVTADEVEFLTPRSEQQQPAAAPAPSMQPLDISGFTEIANDDFPF